MIITIIIIGQNDFCSNRDGFQIYRSIKWVRARVCGFMHTKHTKHLRNSYKLNVM